MSYTVRGNKEDNDGNRIWRELISKHSLRTLDDVRMVHVYEFWYTKLQRTETRLMALQYGYDQPKAKDVVSFLP
jgi:hypothetical protein